MNWLDWIASWCRREPITKSRLPLNTFQQMKRHFEEKDEIHYSRGQRPEMVAGFRTASKGKGL